MSRLRFDANTNSYRTRHEILATECLHAPAMASTLFVEETHRAAFDFDLEEDDFDFDDDDVA